jgi:hypothetical protein
VSLSALLLLRTAYFDVHPFFNEILAFNDTLTRFKELNAAVFNMKKSPLHVNQGISTLADSKLYHFA